MIGSLNPWDWSGHTLDVMIVLGTVGAVVVAVLAGLLRRFLAWIGERRSRPSVTLKFDPETDLAPEGVQFTQQFGQTYDAIYARLRAENASDGRAAEQVEVVVSEIEPLEPSENIDPKDWSERIIRSFGSLGWSSVESPSLTLGPGASRLIDLGWIIDVHGDCTFHMGLKVQPASGIQNLAPGRYRLVLTVSAENVNARRWGLDLEYDGVWTKSQPPEDHLKITNLHRL